MKLTVKEKRAVELLRKLDAQQRDEVLAKIRTQVTANRITVRIGQLKRLSVKGNKRVEQNFGTAPIWKLKRGGQLLP